MWSKQATSAVNWIQFNLNESQIDTPLSWQSVQRHCQQSQRPNWQTPSRLALAHRCEASQCTPTPCHRENRCVVNGPNYYGYVASKHKLYSWTILKWWILERNLVQKFHHIFRQYFLGLFSSENFNNFSLLKFLQLNGILTKSILLSCAISDLLINILAGDQELLLSTVKRHKLS